MVVFLRFNMSHNDFIPPAYLINGLTIQNSMSKIIHLENSKASATIIYLSA